MKKFILVFSIGLLAIRGSAQPIHLDFTSLTSKDGLLSNSVNAILKDRFGLMWFATDDGLYKFDGTNFLIYRHIPGDSNSLRANEILALYEDSPGDLWVGTSGGAVSRYDRKNDKFIQFPATGDQSGLVPNAVVRGITSDQEGKIWIAQFESPFILDPRTMKMTRIKMGNSQVTASNGSLNCIFRDGRGRIWIGTANGLFLYLPTTHSFKRFGHISSNPGTLIYDDVRALAEDLDGRLWIGTAKGLCTMRSADGVFQSFATMDPDDKVLGGQPINAIVPDKDGMLWVGTMEGLRIMDPRTGRSTSYLPGKGNIHGLTSRAIKSIYIDKEGIYWLGTYRGGINKYDRNLNLFDGKLSDAFLDNGSASSIVTSFAERKDGKVWVGTDGGGLYCFDRAGDALQRVHLPVDGRDEDKLSVLSLTLSHKGRLYIGTLAEGLVIMDTATGKVRHMGTGRTTGDLSGNDIYSIREDSKGQVWLGTNGQGVDVLRNDRLVARLTPSPMATGDIHLPVNGYIRAIEEDRDGNIWIGSHGGGLAVFHPKDSSFTLYNQNNSRLPIDKVHALLCDSRGRMWVGTYGGGLCVFDEANGQFIHYTEKDGLQNSAIYQLVEDGQGRIWASTNTGISCFDPASGSFRNFTAYNGLQNNNFVHGSGLRLSDGELLFGGLQGFNYFYPSALTINRNVPEIRLTDLQIANRSVEPAAGSTISEQISVASEIRLDYKQNFALSFVALNYTLPKQNHYAYKLEGFDKEWNYSGTQNTARYTNLDPGEYVFRVRASNNDGIWSTADRVIRIYVKPPFWRTPYAYVLYVLVAAGGLWYSRHRGLSRVRKKFHLERERAEVRQAQELDRMKLKFLTNLSHEFRTPISLIMGPVDQLLAGPQWEGSKDRLSMIRRNARRLLNLVNQLLDFRKMEEQELKLQLSAGEIVAFVKDIVYSFTDLAGKKQILLRFEADVHQSYLLFDHDKLERILFNLLSNAFKFTLEKGAITVSLHVTDDHLSANEAWAVISVTDTGVGIPEKERPRIFHRFFQHSTGDAVLNQGTGIGLSIVQEFVGLHGGSIDVESEVERGSTFTVRLPLQRVVDHQATEAPKAEPAAGTEVEASSVNAPSGTETVLLVEDNEDFRAFLKESLQQDYRIIEAGNGKEGWQKALSGHPQLIVSDISMPYMDGIALSRKLKADRRTFHIPIILLTALTGESQQLLGLETGANDYITKPFHSEVLQAKIRSLLGLRHNLQTTYSRRIEVRSSDVQVQTEDERLLQAVARCLEENITSPDLSVEFLSRQVGMSRSSLYGKLLEITGVTPVEFIRAFKLDKAAVLLQNTDLTIAEVAYETGFTTPNYFAKAFRARFNVLPSEFVAQKRKTGQNKGA